MEWFIICGYGLALLIISIFSFEQLYLAILYRRIVKKPPHTTSLKDFPMVTVQLPIFNEKYVAERLIDCTCQLNYPKEKLEIQVLDDSNDETAALIRQKVNQWQQQGIHIHHVTRSERTGYKAGALQHGLTTARGEFIAIFDADFLPEKDFLQHTLAAFEDHIGMVQTRWGHINQDYSLLTQVQAFGLNAHFTVEQSGRNASGKLMNFNGTAGVWRRRCIEEAGGWEFDTLTEDLDLSYRAQLKGWEFKYLEDVISPAELPVLVPAIKSQQYRWNKGAAETARKNVGKILHSKLSFSVKLHALLHLFNSSVFLFLLIASLLSIPMLYIKDAQPELKLIFDLASIFILGFVGMTVFYWIAARALLPEYGLFRYLRDFFFFITFSMGMALHNAIAVVEGYLGIKTPFVRTPKFNIKVKGDSWKGNSYLKRDITWVTLLEGVLAGYFVFGMISGILLVDFGLILFHAMLAFGFGSVFYQSLKPISATAAS